MKYSTSDLCEKRNLKDAKSFCTEVFNSIPKEKFHSFVLKRKNENDEFNKLFWEEYYPLYLYANQKYTDKSLLIFLYEDGNQDAQITSKVNGIIEKIQITTSSFNKDYAKRNKHLYEKGVSLNRAMRSRDDILSSSASQIIDSIKNKLTKKYSGYLDVLLVVSESRFCNSIDNYFKDLSLIINTKFKENDIQEQNTFKEIYLIDYSSVILKLL